MGLGKLGVISLQKFLPSGLKAKLGLVNVPLESTVHEPRPVFGALGPICGESYSPWRPQAD